MDSENRGNHAGTSRVLVKADSFLDKQSYVVNYGNVFDLGDSIKVDFDELSVDPDENVRNTDLGQAIGNNVIRGVYKPCFYWTQAVAYYILAVPIGAVTTFAWALVFGFNKLAIIWIVRPAILLIFIWLRLAGVVYRAGVRIACDPFYESVSHLWSNIRARVNVDGSVRLDTQTIQAAASMKQVI